MSSGVIFDIKEMSIHDGPGLRTTVFFKGCPLRCKWCHNPEGFVLAPQIMRSRQGCDNCNKCNVLCTHSECEGFGICTKICTKGLVRVTGEVVDSTALASRLKGYEFAFENCGGITISGGEPLMQPEFLLDLLRELKPVHTVLETCGHGDTNVFEKAVYLADLVLFDIKLTNPEQHIEYTGVSSDLILKNLDILKSSGKHFVIRMPIIPGVNDTQEHFEKTAELIADVRNRVTVDILPYNPLAGAKYMSVGLEYISAFAGEAAIYSNIMEAKGLRVRVL